MTESITEAANATDTSSAYKYNLTPDLVPDIDQSWDGVFTPSHQRGSDQIPAWAAIIEQHVEITSITFAGTTYLYRFNIVITIDDTEELVYGWTGLAFNVEGVVYTGTYVRVGNVITLSDVAGSGFGGSFSPTVADIANLTPIYGVNDENYAVYGESRVRRRVEVYFTNSARYRVPFHQGSKVIVEGTVSPLNTGYIVDNTRSFIQFKPGYKPALTDHILFNLMKTDRLFISIQHPFDHFSYRDYGNAGYDVRKYDTNDIDPSGPDPDFFTITINNAQALGYDPVTFYNSAIDTPKAGMMIDNIYDPAIHHGEIWTVKAIAPWKLIVQRISPTVGSISYAYFKEPYNNGVIAFTINNTWSNYYVALEPNSYLKNQSYYVTVPTYVGTGTGAITQPTISGGAPNEEWLITATSVSTFSVLGSISGAQASASVGVPYNNGIVAFTITTSPPGTWQNNFVVSDQFIFRVEGLTVNDPTDVLMNVNLITEHGVLIDPVPVPSLHSPITLIPYGSIIKKRELVMGIYQEYYAFVLTNIPPANTYVELRVEQNSQLNNYARTNFDERIQITEVPVDNTPLKTTTITPYRTGSTRTSLLSQQSSFQGHTYITISPLTAAGMAVTGVIPTLTLQNVIIPNVGVLILTGVESNAQPTVIYPATGSVTLISMPAGVIVYITPAIGALALSSDSGTIAQHSQTVTPNNGIITSTDVAPSIILVSAFMPSAGSLAVTGETVTRVRTTLRTPIVGSLVLSGIVPGLVTTIELMPTNGTIILTGNAPTVS